MCVYVSEHDMDFLYKQAENLELFSCGLRFPSQRRVLHFCQHQARKLSSEWEVTKRKVFFHQGKT